MTNYRIVRDGHGERILRDGEPITLEQAVIELHALQGELDAATAALDKLHAGLWRLIVAAEEERA
jgi:hypothetical protein